MLYPCICWHINWEHWISEMTCFRLISREIHWCENMSTKIFFHLLFSFFSLYLYLFSQYCLNTFYSFLFSFLLSFSFIFVLILSYFFFFLSFLSSFSFFVESVPKWLIFTSLIAEYFETYEARRTTLSGHKLIFADMKQNLAGTFLLFLIAITARFLRPLKGIDI